MALAAATRRLRLGRFVKWKLTKKIKLFVTEELPDGYRWYAMDPDFLREGIVPKSAINHTLTDPTTLTPYITLEIMQRRKSFFTVECATIFNLFVPEEN